MVHTPRIILKLGLRAQIIPRLTQLHAGGYSTRRVGAIRTRQLILQHACGLAAAVVIGTRTHLRHYLRSCPDVLRSRLKGIAELFQPAYAVDYIVVGVDSSPHSVRSISSRGSRRINLDVVMFSYSRLPDHILRLFIQLWFGCRTPMCSSLCESFSNRASVLICCHLASTNVQWRKLYFVFGILLSILSLFVYKGLLLLTQHALPLLVAVGNAVGCGCVLGRVNCDRLVLGFAIELLVSLTSIG